MARRGTRLHPRAGNKTDSAVHDTAAIQGFSPSPQATGPSEDAQTRCAVAVASLSSDGEGED
jgi:hypothetical protein